MVNLLGYVLLQLVVYIHMQVLWCPCIALKVALSSVCLLSQSKLQGYNSILIYTQSQKITFSHLFYNLHHSGRVSVSLGVHSYMILILIRRPCTYLKTKLHIRKPKWEHNWMLYCTYTVWYVVRHLNKAYPLPVHQALPQYIGCRPNKQAWMTAEVFTWVTYISNSYCDYYVMYLVAIMGKYCNLTQCVLWILK